MRSRFQTCILNSHYGHTMCGSMADIQSAAAEIRRGKKRRRSRRKNKQQDENIMVCPITYVYCVVINDHIALVCKRKWLLAFGHGCIMQIRPSTRFRHTIYPKPLSWLNFYISNRRLKLKNNRTSRSQLCKRTKCIEYGQAHTIVLVNYEYSTGSAADNQRCQEVAAINQGSTPPLTSSKWGSGT